MIGTKDAKHYDVSDANTIKHYLRDIQTPFCGIMSHVYSGKTSAMCVKSQLIARHQHPSEDGVRYTRQLFVRGNTNQLLTSTVVSFLEWLDEDLLVRGIRRTTPIGGHLKEYPVGDHLPDPRTGKYPTFPETMALRIEEDDGTETVIAHPYMLGGKFNYKTKKYEGGRDVSGAPIIEYFPDGTFVDMNLHFMPLDNPEWEANLLGTNFTCAHLDEPDSYTNIKDLMTKVPTRLGRYPGTNLCPVVTCKQVNAAFNPAPRDSFMQEFFAKKNEKLGRKLYRIPPPFLMFPDAQEPDNFFKAQFRPNPDAEGINYASGGYGLWRTIIDANRHDPDKIRRDVLGEWTRGSGGALIHPEYNRAIHVAPDIQSKRQLKLFCSIDPGMGGAALFAQAVSGGVHVLEELASDGMATYEFITSIVIPHLRSEYRGFEVIVTGDPTGDYRGKDTGVSSFSPFEELTSYQIEVDRGHSDPELRWSAVNMLLKFKDGLLISEQGCPELIKGFEGGYVFKTRKDGKTLRQADKTNPLSAYQDCLQAIACLIYEGYEGGANLSSLDEYAAWSNRNKQPPPPQDTILWV